MLEVQNSVPATVVTLDMLQIESQRFAGWDELPDRYEILNRGLVEEAPECAAEMRAGAVDKLAVELGDLQWYIAERARLAGLSMADICGADVSSLDDFQQQAVKDPDISLIVISEDTILDPIEEPAAALCLLALRVADAETMTEERLWRGYSDGIPMQRLLRDLYSHVSVIAHGYGFELSYLLEKNIEKLSKRQRSAHVLEDQQTVTAANSADEAVATEQISNEEYARKVRRQREALGAAVHHLFRIDDHSSRQEMAA